ncbi:hypothetical protein PTSG_10665 [Salpingoeca rosetta]|uniref:EGF-like domain-containing protein n=1 Tax=Salpingoeca rosetta (strain ATCC 50818 / BSB-021) TaxID=946362 RepID=F2UQ13_SALR5|nr:uncharacterized protein PTSG_10665 [Salpingoeca rosetta]EGD79681.1 hypothetical protein PTSG_10665 [Salpingoeca rosetta]|eukprot:XP_004988631.1 hypothetical protein PTSG_10665 [Salpingoeca rosetta]
MIVVAQTQAEVHAFSKHTQLLNNTNGCSEWRSGNGHTHPAPATHPTEQRHQPERQRKSPARKGRGKQRTRSHQPPTMRLTDTLRGAQNKAAVSRRCLALALLLFVFSSMPEVNAEWSTISEPFTLTCPEGQGVTTVSSEFNEDEGDRIFSLTCSDIGGQPQPPPTWTADYVNEFVSNDYDLYSFPPRDLTFTCPTNEYLTGIESDAREARIQASRGRENFFADRRWKFQCAKLNGGTLMNCAFGQDETWYRDPFDVSAPSSSVITGVSADVGAFFADKVDPLWSFQKCQITCDETSGYQLVGRTCQLRTCDPLVLPNGVTEGNCTGAFGDECKYKECNRGYELTAFGSITRTCDSIGTEVAWTGTPKECTDADECATGEQDCFPGSVCVNTIGSYSCSCLFGEQRDDSCFVEAPTITVELGLTDMDISVDGEWGDTFPKYRVSVARWSYDLAAKEDIAGFPKTVSKPFTGYHVSNLAAGTRYRVTLTPVGNNDEEIPYFSQVAMTPEGNDPQTICGCIPADPSGAPTDFQIKQFKGHVLFRWADQSQCESAFSFTRNGVGLTSRFPVTEQLACGAIQEPNTVYDDLTIQSAGDYAEVDEALNYLLPEGEFYLRRFLAVDTGDTRFMYPHELQRQKTHFSSTSTTTTAAPQGVPDDEHRYYPGTSSPVASVSECKDLCDIRSDWCIAFVVQTKSDDTLVCHQLRVIETATLRAGEKKAVSFERVTVTGTGVDGSYIFDGTQDDCEEACSAHGSCDMTMVAAGVCAVVVDAVETETPLTQSVHPDIDPTFSRRIPGPEPGTTQEYCIEANKPEWYDLQGYSSDPTCSDFTIMWESQLEGQITIDSKEIHLPVEGVEVEFEIGGLVRGRRITNEDGKFFIHILSDKLVGSRHRMTLRFSKTTGNIKHTFTCGGIACTESTLIMEHLRFDHQVNVKDTTSLPFSGIVSIGGTEHEGLPDGCPLKDVEVCLYDRNQANTLINCDMSDSKGRYLISAVLGTSVTVSLSFGNSSHTFERAPYKKDAANAPSGILQSIDATNSLVRTPYYDVTDGMFWENINFKDTTSDRGTVDIAGGLCNLNLGDAVMEFRYDACPTWVKTHTISDRLSKWTLPAQIITVRFKEITRNYEVRGEITRYFSAKLGNSRSLYLDLRNPQEDDEDKKTVRFEYHPPPQLSVEFDREMKHNCNSTEGDRPLHVMRQNEELKATVKVIEDYGEGVGTCDAVPGQIEVENQLGESPAIVDVLNATTSLTNKQLNKLKLCYDTCLMDVTMDEELQDGETVYSNTRIELSIMTGEPETNPQAVDPENPYSKLFRVTMHNLPQDPVTVYEKVVVVGDKVISKFFSVPFPRYQPLAVVQDPPGGLSTVTYSKAYSNYFMKSHTHEEYHGFYFTTGLAPVKVETGVQQCVGLGAAVCTTVADTESTPFKITVDQTHTFGSMDPEDNYGSERVWSFAIELTTSDDPGTAGEKSDMFLVPALNVVWLETEEVSFDVEQCQASKETKVKWSLEGQDNRKVLSWVSALEIENKELPDLRKLLALAEQPPGDDDDDTEEDRAEKIAELKRAIKAWEDNLDRNKEVRQQAADGLLEPVQSMWAKGNAEFECSPSISPDEDPDKAAKIQSELSRTQLCSGFDVDRIADKAQKGISLAPHDDIDNGKDLDGFAASDQDKQDLRNIDTIKFSGGGSTYTFEYDLSRGDSVIGGSSRTHEVSVGVDVEFGFKVFGVGMAFELSTGYNYEGTTADEYEAGVSTDGALSVTLGDPDPYDVFDVGIFVHPDYGTFVFATFSGQSSCPHEPNTVKLEQPGISILKRPEAPVLPGEPAVFELLLKNDGPSSADFSLFYVSRLNQDGLEVVVNGQALETPLVYETFPANSASHVTVTVNQGPNVFKYDPVAVGWRSICETTNVEYVYLEAEFLQPCSPVKLVGEIGESGAFTLNQETMEQDYKPGQIRVVAFNPDHARRTWLEDDRLEKVVIEYKPANSYIWLLARDENGDALDIRERENEYGYITAWWDASTLLEGDYHLRIRAQCQASINEMPDGIDEKLSSVATGVVDRDPPVVYGFPEPADGEFFPGDEMSFQFNEDVECRQPFIFQVSLTVEDYDRDFNNNNMVIVCEGRKISMSLRRGFRYDEVNGLSANLAIANVKDLSGNTMQSPSQHTFTFAELNLADASVTVSGLVVNVPYQDVYADTTSEGFIDLADVLQAELATIVDTDPSRVTITGIAPVDATDYTVGITVSLRFTPETADTAAAGRRRRATTTTTATDLATLLQSRLQDAAYTESLSVLNTASLNEAATVELEPSATDAAQNGASGSSGGSAASVSTSTSSSSSSSTTSTWNDLSLAVASLALNAVQLVVVVVVFARMFVYMKKLGRNGRDDDDDSIGRRPSRSDPSKTAWFKAWSPRSSKVQPFPEDAAETTV